MTDQPPSLDLHEDTDQIAALLDAQRAANDPDTQLAPLEQAANAVADPTVQADLIVDALNFLYENGAGTANQGVVLDDIHAAATALVSTVQQLGTHLKTAVTVAAKLREQREAARATLRELQRAIEDRDASNPQIEMLIADLEEEINEVNQFDLWDTMWDLVVDRIFDETPLHYNQVSRLLAILTDGELAHDSPLWNEITEWIDFADRELGYEED